MSQYKSLDEMIVNAIKARAVTFSALRTGVVSMECERLARELNRDAFRVLDGRLQALRKRGLIEFGKGAWHVVGGNHD